MASKRAVILGIAVLAIGLVLIMTSRRHPKVRTGEDLAVFNATFRDVILRMDNAGVNTLVRRWRELAAGYHGDCGKRPIGGTVRCMGFDVGALGPRLRRRFRRHSVH